MSERGCDAGTCKAAGGCSKQKDIKNSDYPFLKTVFTLFNFVLLNLDALFRYTYLYIDILFFKLLMFKQ